MPLTIALEVGLFAVGIVLYLRFTKAVNRAGRYGFLILAVLLFLVWAGSAFGPPPPDSYTLAISGLFLWTPVIIGYWVDRNRTLAR